MLFQALPIPQILMYVQEVGEKIIKVQLKMQMNSQQGMAFGVYGFAHPWGTR